VKPTKEEIQELARKTLNDHGLLSIPVNPVVLANRLGIKVLRAIFNEPRFSGMTARRVGGETHILVNDNDSLWRKRFTVAHEIAHSILHLQDAPEQIVDSDLDFFRSTETWSDNWTDERRREYEANAFAAELLMPRSLVQEIWSKLPKAQRTISTMARLFQVSEDAMGIRLDELGLS